MSIIYSYPEQSILNAGDMLIGTSVEKVGGKQKNVTKNFTIQQVADFINLGAGFVDPVASDFQIPVFNQGGLKITGSIMSQNAFPNGTGITVAGNFTTTGSLTASSGATIGNTVDGIVLNSPTSLLGPVLDSGSVQGGLNQILISNQLGKVNWVNYEAGLTYEGTWDANTNTTNGLSNSPALLQGVGVSGHFYIVNVEGTTSLGAGLDDWHVGDWAVFLDEGGQAASWQKIDNTSTLTGSGTAGTFAKWTNATTLNDSIMSESGSVVTIGGSLKIQDTLEATTANTNLKLKGAGTGGVEIMSADGVTVGKITLNCEVNSHGITIQSPPHPYASYALALPVSAGTVGQVLTSGGASPQLTWSSPATYDLGSSTDGSNVRLNLDASTGTDSFVTLVGSGIGIAQVNDTVTFTVPAGDTYDLGTQSSAAPNSVDLKLTSGSTTDDSIVTLTEGTGITLAQASDVITISGDTYDLNAGAKAGTSVPLNLTSGSSTDNSVVSLTEGTGITLTRNSATEITIAGAAQGVTSVTGDSATIAVTSGNTPQVSAITTGGVATGSTSLATGAQIQTAIDSALAGAVTFKGTFNANTGSITGTSDFLYNPGDSTNTIPIAIGDMYIVTVAGNFYGNNALNVGDEVIAIAAAGIGSSLEVGWNAVASGAGGAITGSGTTNYVPKFTGSTVVGNSSIFDDGFDNIGIGTNSPAYSLDIDSNTVTPTIQIQDSGNSTFLRLSSDSGSYVSKIESSNDVHFLDGNGDMLMNMTTMSGYIGIGTLLGQFPFTKLHINDEFAQNLLTLESEGETQRTNYHDTSNTSTYASFGTNYGSFTMGLEYNGNVNQELFRFMNDGRLGIGPSVYPNYTLDVQEGYANQTDDAIISVTSQNSYNQLKMGAGVNYNTNNYIDSSAPFEIKRGAYGVMYIDFDTMFYAPRVGINTTTPVVSFEINAQDAIKIPVGSNSDKSQITSSNGMLRYNSDELEFEGYSDGAWGAIGGGGGASNIVSNTSASNGTVGPFSLGGTPSGNSTTFVDVFIDGVYQQVTTYSIAGANNDEIEFINAVPSGVTIETKTTTGVNSGAAVTSVDLGQTQTTGAINLRITPSYVTNNDFAYANHLYIFDNTTTAYTLTLPSGPQAGDSIKISNRGGLATNVLAVPATENIMGGVLGASMTINNVTAAFEIIYSGDSSKQGWVIIGNV